ncbi:hypothetical protein [Bradyrhizobium sp. LHD-71]|uniref:hypothetical protein n=1 Tax=Bradyrhizobium sp. LHD-71 TaxID=3072141 RepID=UPI00280F10C2|nr:hypothetical protein [Bradyrhizobium sp. LHD-71]MDQ8726538.1 hypothetical protein [Bradyrhizobium sp. LHD-71]
MASEPKRPDDRDDNVVSLREARARQAAAQAKSKNRSGNKSERKIPALLIFLGLLAILVAYKFLLG